MRRICAATPRHSLAAFIALGVLLAAALLAFGSGTAHAGRSDFFTAPQDEGPALSIPAATSSDIGSATVMVYLNGSDLESDYSEATYDIAEMISAGVGDNVNVVLQTMGTRQWQAFGISSKTSQRYRVHAGGLELLQDNLGQLDCTSADTLADFIGYCKTAFPADRYMLLMWDHGGGPVYGFGYDEWQWEDAALTLDEMATALAANPDVRFDIIGMDCCIMASIETCYVLAPYCRYTVLSEDFESGLGWSYESWMRALENDPGMSAPLLGQLIIDSTVEANDNLPLGDSTTLAMIDESAVAGLFDAWASFAYANEDALLQTNYSREHEAKGRSSLWSDWGYDYSDVTLSDYFVTDILATAEAVGGDDEVTHTLKSQLLGALAYFGHTKDANELTGLAVTLPYGDATFYRQLKRVYGACGIDADYIEWLGKFVNASGAYDYNDYSDFDQDWGGWGSYEADYGNGYGGMWSDQGYDPGYQDDWGWLFGWLGGGWWDDGSSYGYDDYLDDDDWEYDYEDGLWYLYEDGILYAYDPELDDYYAYDAEYDVLYLYDDYVDDWVEME